MFNVWGLNAYPRQCQLFTYYSQLITLLLNVSGHRNRGLVTGLLRQKGWWIFFSLFFLILLTVWRSHRSGGWWCCRPSWWCTSAYCRQRAPLIPARKIYRWSQAWISTVCLPQLKRENHIRLFWLKKLSLKCVLCGNKFGNFNINI